MRKARWSRLHRILSALLCVLLFFETSPAVAGPTAAPPTRAPEAVADRSSSTPAQPTSDPLTWLQPGFSQTLVGVSPASSAAVAPSASSISAGESCASYETLLSRYDNGPMATAHGTSVRRGSSARPDGTCEAIGHPDGTLYANTAEGVVNVDAGTGTVLQTVGPPGSGSALAVEPVTRHLIYPLADCGKAGSTGCDLVELDPASGSSVTLGQLDSPAVGAIAAIAIEPTGSAIFVAATGSPTSLFVLTRGGTVLQRITLNARPVGVAVHSGPHVALVVASADGSIESLEFPGGYQSAPR